MCSVSQLVLFFFLIFFILNAVQNETWQFDAQQGKKSFIPYHVGCVVYTYVYTCGTCPIQNKTVFFLLEKWNGNMENIWKCDFSKIVGNLKIP